MSWVLVTGSTRGIGLATANRFADDGYNVILHGRHESSAARLLQDFSGKAVDALYWSCDFEEESIQDSLKSFLGAHNIHPSVLVNNAGVSNDGLFIRQGFESWERAWRISVSAAHAVTQVILRDMLKNRQGTIINVSSIVSERGHAGQTGYAAAKGALVALTRSLALEVASRGVRVNSVSPGLIETDMTQDMLQKEAIGAQVPLGRLGSPQDVASVITFLASDGARYMTGQNINVCGGLSL